MECGTWTGLGTPAESDCSDAVCAGGDFESAERSAEPGTSVAELICDGAGTGPWAVAEVVWERA